MPSPLPAETPTEPDWSMHWDLDPGLTFLNHGSFGACPRALLQAQSRYRASMEGNPMRFFLRELEGLLDRARNTLAGFVGARPESLAFVPNATSGANTVLRALEFAPGDEILIANMGYPGVNNAVQYAAGRTGARVVVADLPWPCPSEEAVLEAIEPHVSKRTKLCVFDHLVSSTALVLPITRIVKLVEGRGVPCLVDGAHAVGMLDLDLDALGASYYVSNCHKWLCTPKGSAFLYVRSDRRDEIHPLTISHGHTSDGKRRPLFWEEFDWPGTHDPTAWLCVHDAIEWFAELVPGGWPAIRERNRRITLQARDLICDRLGTAPPCPATMVGSMANIPLPDATSPPVVTGAIKMDSLHHALREHGMELYIPYFPAHPKRSLRVAVQLYNNLTQFERLADLLPELLAS